MNGHLQRRADELHHRFRMGELAAKDIAVEEGISPRTAERNMRAGAYGPIIKHNARRIRVTVDGYIAYLDSKTVVLRESA